MEAVLSGPGANVKLTGAYVLGGRQELDYDTYQQHAAPNTYSDLAFKGVLADKSKSVWRGMIAVDRGAQGTDAYQENRNLLLHNGCHADSIPGLQIEANEVRCTHGATIAKVEPEQLFYLMARGLSREAAVQLLVRGFFAPILARVADETLREPLQEALWERMASAAATAAVSAR
jgi:Fe-S cluster assembly protein SufD